MQEITSRRNPQVQHLKKLGTDRAYREASGAFLCEGAKLYEEAVLAGATVTLLATCEREIAEKAVCPAILVPEDVLASISPLKAPQSVLFACEKLTQAPVSRPLRVLVLEGIQDPGNMGTLLRSAAAFAVHQVILVGDCADIYNMKTVRASMGALFRQRVCVMTLDALTSYVAVNEICLLGAALQPEAQTLDATLRGSVAVAIGNEGKGLSASLLARCHGTVRIPMEPAAESLNAAVAGSVLLWELYRTWEGGSFG